MKVAFGLLGILLITRGELTVERFPASWFLAPLLAGLLIALWVSFSHLAKSAGAPALTISFYYDLFALVALVAIRQPSVSTSVDWLRVPHHLLEMIAYSVFVGLVPNLLFYKGSVNVGARAAGLTLLLEPLIATVASHFLWHDRLAPLFFVGMIFILAAALPLQSLLNKITTLQIAASSCCLAFVLCSGTRGSCGCSRNVGVWAKLDLFLSPCDVS